MFEKWYNVNSNNWEDIKKTVSVLPILRSAAQFLAFNCFQCPLSPPWLTSSARAIESATWRQGQQLHWLKACESIVYGIRCCRARRQGLRQDLQDSSWSLGQVAELPLSSLAWLSGARLQPATVMSKPSELRITDNPLRPSKRVPFANEIDSRLDRVWKSQKLDTDIWWMFETQCCQFIKNTARLIFLLYDQFPTFFRLKTLMIDILF